MNFYHPETKITKNTPQRIDIDTMDYLIEQTATLPEQGGKYMRSFDSCVFKYLEKGILYLGFKELTVPGFKRVLLKLSDQGRDNRPRKCRRLDGLDGLMSILSASTNIWKLSLVGNHLIGDEGTELLHLIPDCVRDLDMSDCSLTVEGIKNICEFLKTNKTITRVTLWGNKIGDEGATYLANMLEVNRSVRDLCIMQSGIGPQGNLDLSRGLMFNSTLRGLTVYHHHLTENHVWAICCFLEENRGLETLDILSAPRLSRTIVLGLARMLEENVYLKRLKLGYEYPEITYWLSLNKLNRKLICDKNATESDWVNAVVESAEVNNLDAIYFFVRNKPELCSHGSSPPRRYNLPSKEQQKSHRPTLNFDRAWYVLYGELGEKPPENWRPPNRMYSLGKALFR
jgi:hypothetical protein